MFSLISKVQLYRPFHIKTRLLLYPWMFLIYQVSNSGYIKDITFIDIGLQHL